MIDEDKQDDDLNSILNLDNDDVETDFNFDDILEEVNQESKDDVIGDDVLSGGNAEVADVTDVSDISDITDVADITDDIELPELSSEDVDIINDEEVKADTEHNTEIEQTESIWEDKCQNYIRVYDGSIDDKMYRIDKNFEGEDFQGSESCNTIHVDTGNDCYGWNINFANGVNMSLRDVREYQKRQGCLPFTAGTLKYGNKVLHFSDVKRIVVFESVKYFSYGA